MHKGVNLLHKNSPFADIISLLKIRPVLLTHLMHIYDKNNLFSVHAVLTEHTFLKTKKPAKAFLHVSKPLPHFWA